MGISRTRALLPLAVMALASVVGFVIGRVTIGPGPPDSFPDQPLAAAKMTVGKVELQIRRANELMAKGTPLAEVSRRATEKELAH